jgi:UDP-glucose 4-epimerase
VREIAFLCAELLDLAPNSVRFDFGTENRGWKGDVPIIRLNTDRIQSLGWKCSRNTRKALADSILAMIPDARNGKLG